MAQTPTYEDLLAEARNRGLVSSTESVMDETPTRGEFSKFAESTLKGIPKGVIDIVGGWGNLYDYLKKSNTPSMLSSAGIAKGIRDLTGVDILTIPGYKGAYEFSSAGAPQAAGTMLGVPGLFKRTPAGVAGEFGVGGTTGVLGQTVAPESPLAQLAIGVSPYAAKGLFNTSKAMITRPEGPFPSPAATAGMLDVAPLTPGQLGLNRQQLATEARVSARPESGAAPQQFAQRQAASVESFLTKLFDRASSNAMSAPEATNNLVTSFRNYGKALSSRLRSDAQKDFKAAKTAGGQVDTSPIIGAVDNWLGSLPPELRDMSAIQNAAQRIKGEYYIPETPTTTTPSAILNEAGRPAAVTVTPGTPAQAMKIDIDRLQKNLSAWGEAVYSGKADFGKGNIFEGVAPGQVKGAAISVLNGFRDALDQAISQGVAGADKLKSARDKFSANIKAIEEYSNRPLVKYFDVANPSELVPEQVVAKLKNLPPSQRAILIDVMQNSPNANVQGVLDTVRRSTFDDILGKSAAAGGAETAPTFAVDAALREMDRRKGSLGQLFASAGDLKEAETAMRVMRRILSGEAPGGAAGPSASATYTAARAMGGSAATALSVRDFLYPILRDVIASPEAFAKVIYQPENRKLLMDLATPKTTMDKAMSTAKALAKATAIGAARGGPSMSTVQPTVNDQLPEVTVNVPAGEIDYEELRREIERRGLTVPTE
jgi:hypothetical protein